MPIPIRTTAPVPRPASKQSGSTSHSKLRNPGGGALPDSHLSEHQEDLPSAEIINHATSSAASTRVGGGTGTVSRSSSSLSTVTSTGNTVRPRPNFGRTTERDHQDDHDRGQDSVKSTLKPASRAKVGTGLSSLSADTATRSTTAGLAQRGKGNGNGTAGTRHARTISSSTASLTRQTSQRLAGAHGSQSASISASASRHGLQSSAKTSASASAVASVSRLTHPSRASAEPGKPADGPGRKVPMGFDAQTLRDELLQLQMVLGSASKVLAEFSEDVHRKDGADSARVEALGVEVRRLEALDRSARNAKSLKELAKIVEAKGDTMESFWQRLSLALDKVSGHVRWLSKEDGDKDGVGDFGSLVDSLVDHVTKCFTGETQRQGNLSSLSPSHDQDQRQSGLYDLDSPINDHSRTVMFNNQQDLALQVEVLKAVPATNADLGLATVIQRHLDAANVLLALYAAIFQIDQLLEGERKLRRSTEVQLAIVEARGQGLRSERGLQQPIWSTLR